MSKRKRISHPKRQSIWDTILQSWSILKDLSPLKDVDGVRSFQFVVQNEPVIITTLEHSNGANSVVFILQFKKKKYILKQHKHTSGNNIPGDIEAEMQIYAARAGFAPKCLAYTKEAILIEQCTELHWSRPVDCYKNKRGLNYDLRAEYNMLRTGLSKNGQMILDLSKRMGAIGMFNMDQNPENYMTQSNGDFVQIDYGMNRFYTVEAFDYFYTHLTTKVPYTKKQLRTMLLDNSVAYPPAYYWGRYFMKNVLNVHGTWDETEWDFAIGRMGARMAVLCDLLNSGNKYYKKETKMRLKF